MTYLIKGKANNIYKPSQWVRNELHELKSDLLEVFVGTCLNVYIQSKCLFRCILHSKREDALILRQYTKAITIVLGVLVRLY